MDTLSEKAAKLVAIAKDGLTIHFHPEPGSFIAPHGYAFDDAGTLIVLSLDMPTEDARRMLKRELPAMGAVAFVHITEAWSAVASDPEEVALIERLKTQGRLQDAPKHLLREVVNIFVETPDMPVRAVETVIEVAPDGTRTLGAEWVEKTLTYPRPTFRRYFPEGR